RTLAQVRQPVPGIHALDADPNVVAERGDGFEEGVGPGGEVLVEDDGAGVVKDAQVQGPGMAVEAAVESAGGRPRVRGAGGPRRVSARRPRVAGRGGSSVHSSLGPASCLLPYFYLAWLSTQPRATVSMTTPLPSSGGACRFSPSAASSSPPAGELVRSAASSP